MSYQGNASLAAPVQERVVSTFQQALTLYRNGRVDEAVAGCTLIRQMDPMFEPAKQLLAKIENPALHPHLDDPSPFHAGDVMQQAREAMAARDFGQVIHLTTEILTNDLLNDDARVLGDEAREMVEAAPFVRQFVSSAEQQMAAGNPAGARADLDKARSLDPTHPEIVRLDSMLGGAAAAGGFDSSSFVVDDSAASGSTGRGTAQAADFGFTFEEAASPTTPVPEFSFDAPATPPHQNAAPLGSFSFDSPASADAMVDQKMTFSGAFKTPVTGEFDFSSAVSSPSENDQRKVQDLLREGDSAFSTGAYQQAIDVWSRVFLIDVTNDQASERIERAKAKRAEIERQVDDLVASGVQAFERRDRERARADFAEVLRLDPNNSTARDYSARIAAFEVQAGATAAAEAPQGKIGLDFFEEEELPAGAEIPLTPPDPNAATAAKPAATKGGLRAAAPTHTSRRMPIIALMAVVVLVALAAAGWFAWSRLNSTPDIDPQVTKAIFVRATTLARGGRYDQAIAALQEVKPGDPEHDEALVMIADLQQKKAASSKMIGGRPATLYYEEKIAAGRAAFDVHDYVEAKRSFEEAMRVKALPPDIRSSYELAAQQVAKLDGAKALFTERKYADAITNLQPLLAQDPENKNIRRIISDAHFNLGSIALQEDRLDDAVKEFEQVLATDPNDELARRSRELATRYLGQPKDLLFRIYVKYLPLRQIS